MLHPEDKEPESAKPSFESPTDLDLHPEPETSARISKRVGLIIGAVAVLVLIGFAYGGYRRSAKAQATAEGRGRPRMLAPAADADIVKSIPSGNAAVTRVPAVQPTAAVSQRYEPVATSNPCFIAGKPNPAYRFNPETGQPCSAPLERVVVRRAPAPVTNNLVPVHEMSPERACSGRFDATGACRVIAPTSIRSSDRGDYLASQYNSPSALPAAAANVSFLVTAPTPALARTDNIGNATHGLLSTNELDDYNAQNEQSRKRNLLG